MPFTPTHIIAVVPLAGVFRTVPFSALAVGAMVPDLPMFVGLFSYAEAHSLHGLFTTCLPLGLAAFVVFELIMRRPLQAALPACVQSRMKPPLSHSRDVSVTQLVLACVCILIGAATHVFWDSFTHAGRWGTVVFPVLNSSAGIAGLQMPAYKIAQHGSSAIGLPLLLAVWIRSLRRTPPDERRVVTISPILRYGLWGLLLGVPIVLLASAIRSNGPLEYRAFVAATRTISILLVAFATYALLFQAAAIVGRRSRQRQIGEVPGD
ncbi:MAG: DUF4184 family protein [Planctomycetaceae bacterium]